ncbi:MAG: hypothetical protein ILP18_00105 [Treponema sp.]|nr:hypothetical protein [Treponema sp.]
MIILAIERVKADNKAFREGFSRSGEALSLIGKDYEQTINALLTKIT